MSLASTRPLNSKTLLSDLQKLVRKLEDDLRERSNVEPDVQGSLRSEWDKERAAGHTASTYETWRDDYLTQVAVAWVLACVFVRWMEDNDFLTEVYLAGEGDRMKRAHDSHDQYFNTHPTDSDKDYLLHVFATVAKLPACEDLLGQAHNPLWRVAISADAGKLLLGFWQATNPDTQELLRVFETPERDTRFLGDLYQDLSEAARKKYALLQTPDFVEEFILDRTLEPAIQEFGLETVRMIDPTCGSGHFMLGAFRRVLGHWGRTAPGMSTTARVIKSLEAVAGVDLNPFAVAIARFRLLVAALGACGVRRMKDAPDFHMNLATGDSLLHGRRFDRTGQYTFDKEQEHWLPDAFSAGDFEQATQILSRQYHVVVGNPPYITDKDEAHREYARKQYESCYQKFSLAVPFTERFFDLTRAGDGNGEAGFVGMITANSFMKREFGKKLIESYFPKIDLTHVIDTSGAYIPGHGTPTVILFGRHRGPRLGLVRAVMGIRGEPGTPAAPAQGKVWQAILGQVGVPGSKSEFVSVSDTERGKFEKHPWSIGGGGAAELKNRIEDAGRNRLGELSAHIGIGSVTGEDDAYTVEDGSVFARKRLHNHIPLLIGDSLRDWTSDYSLESVWPYDRDFQLRPLMELPDVYRWLWPVRQVISQRRRFGTPMLERGLTWYEWQELYAAKLRTPLSITFAEVSTHNHFILDRGGRVFKQTAPIIKLSPSATEDDHLSTIGLLNTSTACFWLKQVCFPKGGNSNTHGWALSAEDPWDRPYAFNSSNVERFPIVDTPLLPLTKTMQNLVDQRASLFERISACRSKSDIAALQTQDAAIRSRMITIQEEMDWIAYRSFGLLESAAEAVCSDLEQCPLLEGGQRAFEVALARKLISGEAGTAWFRRHRYTPLTSLPEHWPANYRKLVQHRLQLIESDPNMALIEQPEYKRRWQWEPWDELVERKLRAWLLDRLEAPAYWSDCALTSAARLSDQARHDQDFMRVAALYRNTDDFDTTKLVTELVLSESVPYLPAFRYTESGLSKRQQWEDTWALQRREDAGENVGKIPVPPKYANTDFQKPEYWRLRGKLDVPKERFILYPQAEREADPSPVITWAGFDHKQQAQALASYYTEMRDDEGWSDARLEPLLGGLLELLPWLKQWHNDIDPETRVRLGDFYEGFLEEEARRLGKTLSDIRAWTPPKTTRTRKARGRQ